jgi:Ser/Thr protein kinase RdoA (MazF antagonist)
MKNYDQLTRLGQLRRLRKLAETALEEYGLTGATLTFLHYEGNVIFRVDVPGGPQTVPDGSPYVPNRYNLRILSMNDPEATHSELTWLSALRQDAGLPVPEPVPTLDGKLLTTITTPGVPKGRVVSLMRWVDGQKLTKKSIRQMHARAWGRLMGQLHAFAANWQPPKGFKRFHWDWDGLLGNGVLRTPVDELVALMPVKYQEPYKIVSQEIKSAMESFGKEADSYGMIHTDMYLENLLFKAGEPRAIDFEDCGFGYWLYDIGIVLSQWIWTPEYPWIRDAFLEGYSQIRTLPDEQTQHLALFTGGRFCDFTLWGTAFIKNDPARTAEHEQWRNEAGDNLLRYFRNRRSF